MNKRVIFLTRCAACVATLATPSLAMSFFGDGGGAAGTPQEDVSVRLASAIMADIGDRATTSSSADLEGFIIYVISQGDYSQDAIGRALDSIGAGASGNMKTAVDNVRIALLKKRLNRGTAAIVGGGSGFGGGSNFSSPGVSIGGGGTANYTG